MPAVSVVMSVYNGQEFLAEAVESVAGQTFSDFEFVIVDDGSTDATADILAEYAKRDRRVRVLRHENRGRPESLNRGIEAATAPLIARMDADDVSLRQRFEQQVEFMRARPDVVLLGGAAELITPERRTLRVYQPPTEDTELRATLLRHNPFRHPALMLRREAVLGVGGYRKALLDADDYDLILRIAERGAIANLRDVVILYRVHQTQASVTNLAHQALCGVAARKAASFRERGLRDPLDGIEEITREFVRGLGASEKEIRADAAGAYVNWIGLLAEAYPEESLRLVDALLELCDSGRSERNAVAVALVRAAGIHFRRGNLRQAFASAGRGVLAQPIEAGRHLKWALARRAGASPN